MIRDVHSNALISVDTTALDKYKQERQRVNQINQLRKEVSDLQVHVRNLQETVDRIIKEK